MQTLNLCSYLLNWFDGRLLQNQNSLDHPFGEFHLQLTFFRWVLSEYQWNYFLFPHVPLAQNLHSFHGQSVLFQPCLNKFLPFFFSSAIEVPPFNDCQLNFHQAEVWVDTYSP